MANTSLSTLKILIFCYYQYHLEIIVAIIDEFADSNKNQKKNFINMDTFIYLDISVSISGYTVLKLTRQTNISFTMTALNKHLTMSNLKETF